MRQINDLPKSIENEKYLIGCLLTGGNKIWIKIKEQVAKSDFWDSTNKDIFEIIDRIGKQGGEITLATVKDRAKIRASEIVKFMNCPFTVTAVDSYIEEVKRTSNLRKLISAGADIEQLGYKGEADVDGLMSKAQELLSKIESDKKDRLMGMNDMLIDSMQRFDERAKNKGLVGITTGYKDLDTLLHGFRRGSLYVLAARPAQGKTSLVMDIARKTAKAKSRVLIFSLEQSYSELIDKLVCQEGRISLWGMQSGHITDKVSNGYSNAVGKLSELDIRIDDNGGITPMHIRGVLNKVGDDDKPDLVIIDYLQLMQAGKKTSGKYEEVTFLSQQLKSIAKEYDVPVLSLAQLNRGIESRGNKNPRLSDLRDSGSIEQDSDVVMFLQRDMEELGDTCKTDLTIAKHRAGPIGVVELIFNKKSTNFDEVKEFTHNDESF